MPPLLRHAVGSALSSAPSSSAATPCSVAGLTSAFHALCLPTLSPSTTITAHTQQPLRPTTCPASRRGFHASAPQLIKTLEMRAIPGLLVPPYPYGERTVYKQSNTGLYGAARVRTGNVNSGDDAIKVKRTWLPNVQEKRFWSPALKAWVRTRMTLRIFRTIRHAGGIDNYVLGDKAARIREMGPAGWRLRWLVMQADSVRARMDEQRRELGLPVPVRAGAAAPPVSARKGAAHAARTAVGAIAQKPGMRAVAMDYATPGKISKRSRDAVDAYLAQAVGMEEFSIGSDAELRGGAGLQRPGSKLAQLREQRLQLEAQAKKAEAKGKGGRARTVPVSPVQEAAFMAAGQALQVRDMADKIARRNAAIKAGSKARSLRRRFKSRR